MTTFIRWISGIALHWFYGSVRVLCAERIPRTGPILVAVNHQNALMDALLAQWAVPRPLRLTAKASLGDSLPGALLLRVVRIIPFRRATDERARRAVDPLRNAQAFERIVGELRAGGGVLVFPEGKSHNEGDMAPLKSGLARAALTARGAGVQGVQVVPVGLSFEAKDRPGSAVVVEVGEPVHVDQWEGNAQGLTRLVEGRLRGVSFQPVDPEVTERGGARSSLVRLASWWGRVVHHIPVTIARRLAVARSRTEDEPAMYTVTYAFGLVVAWDVLQGIVAWVLLGGAAAVAYVASLVVGAYWTAYEPHRTASAPWVPVVEGRTAPPRGTS